MTDQLTDEEHPENKRKNWARRRKQFGNDVAKTVGSLQFRFLDEKTRPAAAATLAKLRRGIGREPGFDYSLDEYLAVPDDLLGFVPPGEATSTERAKHAAVTLYALHQRSQQERMHTDWRGLGTAIAELARTVDSPEGVHRRFAALGTACTYEESLFHLRSLITMLRDKQISLDYGLLADDLCRLREPGGRTDIQAAWGREFFRARAAKPGNAENKSETNNDVNEGINS